MSRSAARPAGSSSTADAVANCASSERLRQRPPARGAVSPSSTSSAWFGDAIVSPPGKKPKRTVGVHQRPSILNPLPEGEGTGSPEGEGTYLSRKGEETSPP
ncbi:hypothetical protein HS125_04400 [bacterium]|nr:hypothetical protein [bacterium]